MSETSRRQRSPVATLPDFSDAYVHETTALRAGAGIGQLDRHEHPRMLGPPRPRERPGPMTMAGGIGTAAAIRLSVPCFR